MKIVLTPHRETYEIKPGDAVPTEAERSAGIAAGRRDLVREVMRHFPTKVRILGIQGKGEILIEIPDGEPDLPKLIRETLGCESGPDPGSRMCPDWNGIQPHAAAISECYRFRHYRPTVFTVIRDASSRLLMVRASRNGEWGMVQGGIEEGELPIRALLRELMEEIRLDPSDLIGERYLGCADIDAETASAEHLTFTKGVRYFIYDVAYRGPEELTLLKSELSAYAWVPARFDDPTLLSMLASARPKKSALIIGALIRILAG